MGFCAVRLRQRRKLRTCMVAHCTHWRTRKSLVVSMAMPGSRVERRWRAGGEISIWRRRIREFVRFHESRSSGERKTALSSGTFGILLFHFFAKLDRLQLSVRFYLDRPFFIVTILRPRKEERSLNSKARGPAARFCHGCDAATPTPTSFHGDRSPLLRLGFRHRRFLPSPALPARPPWSISSALPASHRHFPLARWL